MSQRLIMSQAPAAGMVAVLMGFGFASTGSAQTCDGAVRAKPLLPTDPKLCRSLAAAVRDPSALPLNEYEAALSRFFDNWCHRDAEAGWQADKGVRDTGPFTAVLEQAGGAGAWIGSYHGTHAPVVIWYSPEMADWLVANRPGAGPGAGEAPTEPVPDGAVMVKEMYPAPAAACAGHPLSHLFPVNGAAIMVRDDDGSRDGWFWGWYGWPGSVWAPDWPAGPANAPANMGFGRYCLNCHASAEQFTFADAANMAGQPGEPLAFLSQDFFARQDFGVDRSAAARRAEALAEVEADEAPGSQDIHERVADHVGDAAPLAASDREPDPALKPVLAAAWPALDPGPPLPSQTYDSVWMPAGGPDVASQYLTSDQCLGCHDAGSTGLQFDMTAPNPDAGADGAALLNFSPYATWRSSPMGLAGRDPVFFAQLASETETFHADEKATVETTCLGCHGILGQRQLQIDAPRTDGDCAGFTRAMVDAVPYPPDGPTAAHAAYGALARDGISCMACHHMVLGEEATAKYAGAPQNGCVLDRQAALNPDETGFAKTFTGSFLVGPPDRLYGPFAKPKRRPMEHALGITPRQSDVVASSELCGTCHTVHLPVLHQGQVVGRVYEQTTYAEWAFSAYRTGTTVDGPLPGGAGALAESCQGCHMPSRGEAGPFRSKIASIQEHATFPEAEHTLAAGDIDLDVRDGFAKHTLVGLNVFLVEMFKQFPAVLGIATEDPMLGDEGLDPLLLTERAILEQAAARTVRLAVEGTPSVRDGTLTAAVAIDSLTGHKFPSGVGFRRAFLTFEVLGADGEVLWASGRVNAAGLIVDEKGEPIAGELWWDDQCRTRIDPARRAHQPHYQVVSAQDQAQIYQELVSTPPPDSDAFSCGHAVAPAGQLTTSFLSICAEVKDNRLPPPGYLALEDRVAIARALGAGADLAADAGFTAVGDDPDYALPTRSGGDRVRYEVAVAGLDGEPDAVRATLSYQATPPFYLQDRFCTARGDDTRRLAYLVSRLNLEDTRAADWALTVAETGAVTIAR